MVPQLLAVKECSVSAIFHSSLIFLTMFDKKWCYIQVPGAGNFVKDCLTTFICTVDICSIYNKWLDKIKIKRIFVVIRISQWSQVVNQGMVPDFLSFFDAKLSVIQRTFQNCVHWLVGSLTPWAKKRKQFNMTIQSIWTVYQSKF